MGTWSRQAGFFGAILLTSLVGLSQASAAAATQAAPNPPTTGTYYETPQSLNCIYQLVATVAGCDPNNTALPQNTTLGGHAIVVLTNYHDAALATELTTYSTQFGLPAPNLNVVSNSSAANCSTRLANSDLNSSQYQGNDYITCYQFGIDVLEAAHAMAPAANLVVVEMPYSSGYLSGITPSTLAAGIDAASAQAVAAGGGEVVIAVSDTESSGYTSVESHFTGSNVLYFAASSGAPYFKGTLGYPGTSPNVVSVSSSNIARDMENPMNTGGFLSERAGPSGEGGLSSVFAAPAYQNRISVRTGNANKRAVPDIAAASSSNASIWVYNRMTISPTSSTAGWYAASGPYISAGIAAGIANAAGASNSFKSTASLLTSMYGKFNTTSFFDVGVGICGAYDGAFTTVADRNSVLNQWDFCTGVGAPRGIAAFRP